MLPRLKRLLAIPRGRRRRITSNTRSVPAARHQNLPRLLRIRWQCVAAIIPCLAMLVGCDFLSDFGEPWAQAPPRLIPEERKRIDYEGTSIALPLSEMHAFLRNLSHLPDQRIPRTKVDEICRKLQGVLDEDVVTWYLPVTFDGRRTELELRAFCDNPVRPEIYFYSEPLIIAKINELIANYRAASPGTDDSQESADEW